MQWMLALVLCLWASGIAETRQIRINRYAVSVQEDDVQQAVVRELKPTPTPTPTPYPAAGFRPEGRAFWLPGEADAALQPTAGSDLGTTTTELPLDDATASTTEALDLSTTTAVDSLDATTTAAPIEARSGRAFAGAPYPAAGYRPSRAFLLPTELKQQQQQQQQQLDAGNVTETAAADDSNANHPVCGVSTNPLKPTPEPGSKDEPDAENVLFTASLGPAVLVARAPASSGVPVAIPLRSQPLIQAPRRGFVYTTHVEQRW
ncbi:PREDICTED: uncharacterized protein LOC108614506 [Drosophila arizonae]|uniref:Uncharacterized protein LOC108614506 n=1 Tax=Drosophila arizonae TaxID=7263 RepID=A0ABM1PAB7_DROAR|nr:PREDICTED: uncharacterized protein LOC108614506 [Drosophila arizonae]